MPEGPEVQVIVDGLNSLCKGKKILLVQNSMDRPWIVSSNFLGVLGETIQNVTRKGKFIIWHMASSRKLVTHLSFTGNFDQDRRDFWAMSFGFNDGSYLHFMDKRGLSKWSLMSEAELYKNPTLCKMQVDALADTREQILERFMVYRKKKPLKQLKPALLDYSVVCGIGNIYASEICFEAKLDPLTPFKDLTQKQIERLAAATDFIVKRAYREGGSSIEDFFNVNYTPGHAQDFHMVYGKEVCQLCGGRIIAVKQDGRTTHYCPVCQGGNG